MLEGAVARLLNHLLGKYVVDLDTENLNVGIFSGQVHLTDLKMKAEALYELGLPIEVRAGTIGRVRLQIPWTSLWSLPVVASIEDVHIVCGPVVSKSGRHSSVFDPDKNKRLLRAFKRHLLTQLDAESHVIGGPFAEHLLANLLGALQLTITNVHLRYEDDVSCDRPIAAGLCVGTITAETTNSKWKPSKVDQNSKIGHYLVKMETLSAYWNYDAKLMDWDLPAQYYAWRNAMSSSLQNFCLNEQPFDFIIKPMTTKLKITMDKSQTGSIDTCSTEVVIQDCNVQLSKEQYKSMLLVSDSLSRMLTSWNFLQNRPDCNIMQSTAKWWKYACLAVLEQRVRPYTWNRIRTVREYYRSYLDTYKQIILNPNDTELKLDLQQYEDNLSVVNVVVARQHARLLVQSRSLSEKNFWSMLSSPERTLLCQKYGFCNKSESPSTIEHRFNIRVGNITFTLSHHKREILILTLTQSNLNFQPNHTDDSFQSLVKIEGFILEGCGEEGQLVTIMASEHLSNSPAYFFKAELDKMGPNSKCDYRLNVSLDSVECFYHQQFFQDLHSFFDQNLASLDTIKQWPDQIHNLLTSKLAQRWDMGLSLKIPHLVIPDHGGSLAKADCVLVIDFGRYIFTTELCQVLENIENATQMELEESLYSKLHVECAGLQALFCHSSDNWREAMREKDTDLHLVPKTTFNAIYARCSKVERTIPSHKCNIVFPCLKLNMSERRIVEMLKFLSSMDCLCKKESGSSEIFPNQQFEHDRITNKLSLVYLTRVERAVSISHNFIKYKKHKMDKVAQRRASKTADHNKKEDMNEAWARYVDLPGLEDNISPNNNISVLLRFVVNEFSVVFSRSSDSSERPYLLLRMIIFAMDLALMTYGPAYQISLNSILVTDKLHTTPSGQYLDLVYTPFPSTVDVLTVLYRKVSASCPDFWSHFHGVETSLVVDFGTIHLLLHQEAIHTAIKYSNYMCNKIQSQTPTSLYKKLQGIFGFINRLIHDHPTTPVPTGSVKFSHSARLSDINIRVCDSDFDIVNVQLSGLEVDFLFRANERFVFRSYLSNINVEHLSDVTLYSKVLSTDEDKVFEVKYVRHAAHIKQRNDISPGDDEVVTGGSLKFQLGQIHVTLLYKLVVQLQRFVANLEAFPYINQLVKLLKNSVNAATDTLKANSKIHLAINVCGPVLLFPQKTSSPNVMVVDTGELHVENFFKEYSNDVVENILIKLTGVNISRGVMTMSATLENQETLVEPVNLSLDVKRYTNPKNAQKTWDIDGVLDSIQITLGQRDIATILSIYSENIGEGTVIDLLPDQMQSPIKSTIVDDTVRNLEAFFCEPKQKNIVSKFSLEEITLLLFFDSGELLSSPIRDLNHGLCKLVVTDVNVAFVVYTDRSLDGKISADSILIEEIGPDANAIDKGILQSPLDDNKNNNCNVTINRVPIIDITFHQNKSGDSSADIIIGRLSLSLSVPFCEKLALFVLECLPKDIADIGIVNHGYECDPHQKDVSQSEDHPSSLTISLRINKPEFKFLGETTSNKKRYFVTHCEILSDYSRHGNRLNLIVSLSGLHSIFYDTGIHSSEPYVILKQCDVEFSNCYSEEKGKKVIASISSIYVQICSRVVHSITDILNDIVEHFKVPELELGRTDAKPETRIPLETDLWEPKKLGEFPQHEPQSHLNLTDDKLEIKEGDLHEVLLVPKFDVVVIFELEEIQVLLLKSTLEMNVYDWSSLLNCTCEFTVQANYFNENVQSWEPLIDPVVIDEKEYKPWEMLVKVFQDRSVPMLGGCENRSKGCVTRVKKSSPTTTTEDEESGEDMIYLKPINPLHTRNNRRVKTSLSTFLDDSDSENDDGAMEKLAAAISDLFTGDWNESEDSDYVHSSEGDDDSDTNVKSKSENPKNTEDQSPTHHYTKSTYILVDCKDVLNISLTPNFLKVLSELVTIYSNKTLSVVTNKKTINLVNDIGPHAKVELYEKKIVEDEEEDVLVGVKTFENQESLPNSPTRNAYYTSDFSEDFGEDKDSNFGDPSKTDTEANYDFETVTSLQFPSESTSHLYDKINRHSLKIHVPNFLPVQTNCSKQNWQKLIRLQSMIPGHSYYLAARHSIGKTGRQVVLSSPLQIKNETCFALSVLYQPSVLQQLNLEPVGDVTNPFENTMRIAVLEPHETYNVPLYIAYHCKLFIQPSYAEGHYTSDSGIWWRDLATELGSAHNLQCRPKSSSNLEVFSLRVMLKKNLEVGNLQTHSVPNYVIYLLAPMIMHNFLPYPVEVENLELKQLIKVEPGEKKSVYSLDLSKDQKLLIKIRYNSSVWTGMLNFTTYLDDKIMTLSSDGKDVKNLAINIKADREDSVRLFFYTSYWIINRTGLPLQVKASCTNLVYDSNNDDILLFTYKRHGKQTLNIKVYDSNWSNEFGLECAGTTGLIICKDMERRKKYMFFLTIKMSEMCPRLTKIVTLQPSFVVSNSTGRHLRFMEHNEKTDLWIDVAPQQTVTFWPETPSMQMYVKYRESKLISQGFSIATANTTVLRMDKGGAITVEVTGGIHSFFRINFSEYRPGDAPILVKNYCADLFLKIQQQDQSPVTLLSACHSLLYTWDDPTKTRKLVWNVYNNKGTGFVIDPSGDSHGEEKIRLHSVTPNTASSVNQSASSSEDSDSSDSVKTVMKKKVRKDKLVIYWTCHREGRQRVLLFTQDQTIHHKVMKDYFLEHSYLECLVSLSGIGLSIFTPRSTKKEHIHASLVDAPPIWEVNVGRKWKTFTLELASWIEDKYKLHYKKCQLKDYVHIDFEKMFMLKPFFAELKRTYIPAVYFQFRKSPNYQSFSLKLNSFQIDNKISNSIVLYSLPPPDSVRGLNPFVDVDILKNSTRDCDIYRRIRASLKSFYLDVESDLLLDLSETLVQYRKRQEETVTSYISDMKSIQDLNTNITAVKDRHKQTIIEHISVSSFEIQLHISNKSQMVLNKRHTQLCKILDYLFPLNISPYMPMEGVIHKITSIDQFDVHQDLLVVLKDLEYQLVSQFLQQYYSHVLGLQVLVNPFAIQTETKERSPQAEIDKMPNLLLYGSRCLLSHINMSPAALEQCVVDIFAHQTIENIQRIRRHGSYQKSEIVPKTITASCKNFHSGVPNALDQLIVKQQSAGYHSDGEMFFRTTGKALLSLVTRHPDDKSDSVEVAKEALRRAAILGEPIRIQQRLTRYCNRYLGLKPFSVYESMGQHLLETVGNSRFSNDVYWSHAAVDKVGKSIVLVSLQHVVRINKYRLWGPWEIEWSIDLDDIISMPKVISSELVFNMKQTDNNAGELMKISGDKEMLVWIHDKIEQAIVVSMEEKSWAIIADN